MKTINVTKTITTLTTWRNEETGHYIQFESDTKSFYYFTKNKLAFEFEEQEAAVYLAMADVAVSTNRSELKEIPDTAFLSMVLTQFLHKANTIHNDSNHN